MAESIRHIVGAEPLDTVPPPSHQGESGMTFNNNDTIERRKNGATSMDSPRQEIIRAKSWLDGAIWAAGTFVSIIGMLFMFGVFDISKRLDRLEQYRTDIVEKKLSANDTEFKEINRKLDVVLQELSAIKVMLESHENRVSSIEDRVNNRPEQTNSPPVRAARRQPVQKSWPW